MREVGPDEKSTARGHVNYPEQVRDGKIFVFFRKYYFTF